jgi:hypothetical protein
VWQAKDLRKGDFGSVAMIGVTGEILEVWQRKELGDKGVGLQLKAEGRRKNWHTEPAGSGIAEGGTFRREWSLTIKIYCIMS